MEDKPPKGISRAEDTDPLHQEIKSKKRSKKSSKAEVFEDFGSFTLKAQVSCSILTLIFWYRIIQDREHRRFCNWQNIAPIELLNFHHPISNANVGLNILG